MAEVHGQHMKIKEKFERFEFQDEFWTENKSSHLPTLPSLAALKVVVMVVVMKTSCAASDVKGIMIITQFSVIAAGTVNSETSQKVINITRATQVQTSTEV